MKKWIWMFIGLLVLSGLFSLPFFIQKKHKAVANEQPVVCDVMISVEGQAKPIPLEEYLIGVVAGEMPVSFHEEALKAQAIAARTYVLKSTNGGKTPISPTVLRQVYLDEEQRMSKWGDYFSGNESKLQEIVEETKGIVLTYQGELITAMFHSMSNGQTESAEGFSGNEVPYLITVSSSWEKELPNFTQKKEMTLQAWQTIFGARFSSNSFQNLKLERNNSGRVARMIADAGEWDGREVRELLDLRSTDFDISFNKEKGLVIVTTHGYGHGVGMSQYGADAMAKEGKDAKEILSHYYQSVEISVWKGCLK